MVNAPLVAPSHASLVVRGRVVDYSRQAGVRSVDNVLLERGVRITIEGQLVRRTRDPDGTPREEVLEAGLFASDSGFRAAEAEGEHDARERVLRNSADRMVLDLFGPLAYESAP